MIRGQIGKQGKKMNKVLLKVCAIATGYIL